MIKRSLLLAVAAILLAGCGGAGPKPAKTISPAIAKIHKVSAEKKALIARTRAAAEKESPRNVPGRKTGCLQGRDPAYSPNGEQVVFAGSGHLCVANRDGTGIHPLTAAVDSPFELAWVDSGTLLYADDYVISAFRVDGKTLFRGIEAPSFQLARNGQRFTTGTQSDCPGCVGQAHVWTMHGKRVGTIGDAKHFYEAPAISPNGLRVAYTQDNALWVANADGSHAKRLVWNASTPLWSPTSDDEIAYTTSAGLWVVYASTGKTRLVAAGVGDGGGWSPSGKLIASAGLGNLTVVTVANGKKRLLRYVGYPDYGASPWSPDSRRLLVVAPLTSKCTALWSEPVDGSKPTFLSSCY